MFLVRSSGLVGMVCYIDAEREGRQLMMDVMTYVLSLGYISLPSLL